MAAAELGFEGAREESVLKGKEKGVEAVVVEEEEDPNGNPMVVVVPNEKGEEDVD